MLPLERIKKLRGMIKAASEAKNEKTTDDADITVSARSASAARDYT